MQLDVLWVIETRLESNNNDNNDNKSKQKNASSDGRDSRVRFNSNDQNSTTLTETHIVWWLDACRTEKTDNNNYVSLPVYFDFLFLVCQFCSLSGRKIPPAENGNVKIMQTHLFAIESACFDLIGRRVFQVSTAAN